MTRSQAIEQMRYAPDELAELVRNLTPEQLTTAYLPDEWTVAQNVHHLAEAQSVAYFRFKVMVTEDRPTLTPFDQDEFARSPESTGADIADALAIVGGINRRWAALAESLTEAQWNRVGIHPEIGEITPAKIYPYYSTHVHVHIEQIKKTLAAGES